jgi:hypothetical protein
MSAKLASSEASVLGLQVAVFSLCPHMFFLCECLHQIFFYKDTSQIELGPPSLPHFTLIISLKAHLSKHSPILRHKGFRLQHTNFEVGPQFSSQHSVSSVDVISLNTSEW